jgi:mono/diheme cytochrome c family protein
LGEDSGGSLGIGRQRSRFAPTARRIPLVASLLLASLPLLAQATDAPVASRGELLYRTHCIACHTTQVHWREQKLARDWASLTAQVRRWQANAGLRWPESSIEDVVRYLNTTIYRFPDEAPKQAG